MNKAKRSSTSRPFSDDISLVGVHALASGRYSNSGEYSSYCIALFFQTSSNTIFQSVKGAIPANLIKQSLSARSI